MHGMKLIHVGKKVPASNASMENDLTQLIDEPTYTCNQTFSLLDIILTDSPGYFLNQGVLCPCLIVTIALSLLF